MWRKGRFIEFPVIWSTGMTFSIKINALLMAHYDAPMYIYCEWKNTHSFCICLCNIFAEIGNSAHANSIWIAQLPHTRVIEYLNSSIAFKYWMEESIRFSLRKEFSLCAWYIIYHIIQWGCWTRLESYTDRVSVWLSECTTELGTQVGNVEVIITLYGDDDDNDGCI